MAARAPLLFWPQIQSRQLTSRMHRPVDHAFIAHYLLFDSARRSADGRTTPLAFALGGELQEPFGLLEGIAGELSDIAE